LYTEKWWENWGQTPIFLMGKLGSDPDIPNRRYCKLGPGRIISGFKAGNTYIDAREKTGVKEKLGSDPDIPLLGSNP
jgi:hypothetical protein